MPRTDSGFTLVETLVSLFVIGMLATSGGMLLLQTLQASNAVKERTSSVGHLQIAHTLMRDDFMNMRQRLPVVQNDFERDAGFIGRAGDVDGTALRFIRGGWSQTDGEETRSDLQIVEYELSEGRLIRIARLRPDASSETPTIRRTLLSEFEEVSLRYHDGRAWRDSWTSPTGAPLEGNPSAIEMVFRFGDEDDFTARFLTGARR